MSEAARGGGRVVDTVVGHTRAPYSSTMRSEQSRATRHLIVSAAGELFVERGYAATTIDAIAERAGVSRKTVFTSVGGKGALLKLAWDWALAGDDQPLPMSERPAVRAIIAERDPQRMVRMWVAMLVDVGKRATELGAVVLAAADVDGDARALRDQIRSETLSGATAFATHVAGAGGLRADLAVDQASEACWALVNSLMQHLLVDQRGWSPEQYGELLERLATATLLGVHAQTSEGDPAVRIQHDSARQRYVARVNGRVVAGQLSYDRTDRLLVIIRTDVEAAFDSQGVAEALVRTCLDDVAMADQRTVLTVCPYAGWWIGRHPEYASLVHDV